MSFYRNSKKIKEAYYNGKKIKEAYYNGKKVFSSGKVLFEGDVYFEQNALFVELPSIYPIGSIIEWTPNPAAISPGRYGIYDDASSANWQSITPGVPTVATIKIKGLSYGDVFITVPAITFHIKITGAN